jgi:hypothetical protein
VRWVSFAGGIILILASLAFGAYVTLGWAVLASTGVPSADARDEVTIAIIACVLAFLMGLGITFASAMGLGKERHK